MKIKHIFALVAILMATCSAAVAQNGTMTPYSAYGFGVLRDHATSTQRAMGGVGYAMNSGRQINAMNPASYAAVDSLTFLFDMGIDVTALWQEESQADGVARDRNLLRLATHSALKLKTVSTRVRVTVASTSCMPASVCAPSETSR